MGKIADEIRQSIEQDLSHQAFPGWTQEHVTVLAEATGKAVEKVFERRDEEAKRESFKLQAKLQR